MSSDEDEEWDLDLSVPEVEVGERDAAMFMDGDDTRDDLLGMELQPGLEEMQLRRGLDMPVLPDVPAVPVEEFQREAYEEALKQGETVVKNGRVVFLGPAAVGKTSLKHGLMNKPLPSVPESTVIAKVHHLRPVHLELAKVEDTTKKAYWEVVTSEQENEEIVQLMVKTRREGHKKVTSASSADRTLLNLVAPIGPSSMGEKVEKVLRDAATRAKSIDSSRRCTKPEETWLHVWDCGGQPMFLDLLPAFLTSHTMFLLLFDASKNLDGKLEVLQYLKGVRKKTDHGDVSVFSLLQQWMSVIYSHLAKRDDDHQLVGFPCIFLVGTHGDQADGEGVLQRLHCCCEGKLYSDIMLPPLVVDNTTAGSGDHEDPGFGIIRKAIHDMISEKLAVRAPSSWVLFRKVLKEADENIVSYEGVCELAALCNIPRKEVPSLLKFYHELGVVLFYHHIEELKKWVIVKPTWLVDELGKLLPLERKSATGTRWKVLFEKGILLESLYKAVWKECGIDPTILMKLLVHLCLAAPLPPTGQHDLSGKEQEYFLPCILKFHHEKLPLLSRKGTIHSAPLYITFPTVRFVPPGFFTRLVTALASFCISKGRDVKYKIDFRSSVYRSQVTFLCQDSEADRVVLTELPDAFQVDVVRCVPKFPKPLSFVCQDLLLAIKHCCQQVSRCLYDSQKTVIINQGFKPAMEIKWKYALLCENPDCICHDQHYCYFSPDSSCLLCTEHSPQEFHHQLLWLKNKLHPEETQERSQGTKAKREPHSQQQVGSKDHVDLACATTCDVLLETDHLSATREQLSSPSSSSSSLVAKAAAFPAGRTGSSSCAGSSSLVPAIKSAPASTPGTVTGAAESKDQPVILGAANLQQILAEIYHVTQVMSLGLNLGLHMSAVVKIQTDYKTLADQKACIVYAWLQRQDIIPDMQSRLPTWNELANAVANESNALSMDIRRKYCNTS